MITYGTSLDDVDSRITYSPGWDLKLDDPLQMTGTTHSTSEVGSTAEFRFKGSAIAVVSTIPRGNGVIQAMFTLDNDQTVMVTRGAGDDEQKDVAFWQSKTLSSSAHVLKVTALGGDAEFRIDRIVYTPNNPILFPIDPPIAAQMDFVPSPSETLIPDFTTSSMPSNPTPEPTSTVLASPTSVSGNGMPDMMYKPIPLYALLLSVFGVVILFLIIFGLYCCVRNSRRAKQESQSPLGNRLSFSPAPHARSSMSPFNSISVRTYQSHAPPGHVELPELPTSRHSPVPHSLYLGSAWNRTDRRPVSPPSRGTGPILPIYSPLAVPPPSLQRRSRVLDRLSTFRLGMSRRGSQRPQLRPLYLSPIGLQQSNFAPSSAEVV